MTKDNFLSNTIPVLTNEVNPQIPFYESPLPGLYFKLVTITQNDNGKITGAITVNDFFLKIFMIDERELWKIAWQNIENETVVTTLGNLLGAPEEDPMYVVTNERGYFGSAAIFTEKAKKYFLNAGINEGILLPSSRHEVLIVADGDTDMEQYSDIVSDVNNVVVDPEDRLADTAFYVSFKDSATALLA